MFSHIQLQGQGVSIMISHVFLAQNRLVMFLSFLYFFLKKVIIFFYHFNNTIVSRYKNYPSMAEINTRIQSIEAYFDKF